MSNRFQIFYWIIVAVAAIGNLYFAWRTHRRETRTSVVELQSQIEDLRSIMRHETIRLFSYNLIGVRHLHLDYGPEERLRAEFEFLFDKPDVVNTVREMHIELVQCERHLARRARMKLIQALLTLLVLVTSALAIMPLMSKLIDAYLQYGLVNWISLMLAIELGIAAVTIGLYRGYIGRRFRRVLARRLQAQ